MLAWAIACLLVQSLRGEYLQFYSKAIFENNRVRDLKVTYKNSYSRFVRFSYFFEARFEHDYPGERLSLFISSNPALCRNYRQFVESPTEEFLLELLALKAEGLVYYETLAQHRVSMDRYLKREATDQTLCLVYNHFGAPRGVSNNLNSYFTRHSYEVRYDIQYFIFHLLLAFFLLGSTVLTFYLRWKNKTSQRMQGVLQAVKERLYF